MSVPPREIRPIPLRPNYVWRSYLGGCRLRRFRGDPEGADDHFPEDWLASTVRARNGANSRGPDEGLSRARIGGRDILLRDSFEAQPDFWFGSSHPAAAPGVLWKLLDAADRLQLQVHPDAAFARRHLNSKAGKTECWYVLDTRGVAYVHLAFQRSPGREHWGRLIREQRTKEMLACFDLIPVQPGDCFIVPAGVPHAIGAGVFMLELQEPTDWVVRCEMRTSDGVPLPSEACFMGLDLDTCLDVFRYESVCVAEVRERWLQQPRTVRRDHGFCEEEIIGRQWHGFFRLHRLRGRGIAEWQGGELMLAVILRGAGELETGRKSEAARSGQTWLLPGAASSWHWRPTAGQWEMLLAKPPLPASPRSAAAATGTEPC